MALSALTVVILLQSALCVSTANAADKMFYTGYLSNVAVDGYDPVSYFTQGRPVKGSKDFSTHYQGVDFHFASQTNLDRFKADPTAYVPQYGGYCAWAVSQGYTAKGDAKHWHIENGKLYLNYSASVKKTWESDMSGFIEKANANWPDVLK